MSTKAFYNEIDEYAASWLQNLISAGHITDGMVTTLSITDLHPRGMAPFERAHFFAGIGGWEEALKLAGWPEDLPVWTGSCPCQPFSVAGKRKGTEDERHLWPVFRELIACNRPPIIFGEQVASKDGRDWLEGVRTDLEALGYEVGAADLCAAGVGAPHIRQRLYWVAVSRPQLERWRLQRSGQGSSAHGEWSSDQLGRSGYYSGMDNAYSQGQGQQRASDHDHGSLALRADLDRSGSPVRLGHTHDARPQGRGSNTGEHSNQLPAWAASESVLCADGKTRRFESGSFPLAHGVPNRVGRLRAYGNAIVPPLAAEFVKSVMDILDLGTSD